MEKIKIKNREITHFLKKLFVFASLRAGAVRHGAAIQPIHGHRSAVNGDGKCAILAIWGVKHFENLRNVLPQLEYEA